MATTKTYTKTINVTGYTSCTITYTLTETETTAAVAITKIAWKNTRSTGLTEAISWQVDILGGGVSSVPGFPSTTQTGTASKGSKTWSKTLSGVSKSATKPHSATNATVSITAMFWSSADMYGESGTASLSIPAKTSYKVTLNANGGTGGTASLTKWHGETLSLTSGFTAPTRTGYRLIGWGTSSAATTTIATYTDNAATTLYAVWEKLITGITLDVTTLRVTDGTATAEDDEGTWCYGTCAYNITGPAAADVTFTVSATPNTPQIVQDTFTATKAEDNTLNGSFVFRASACATDASYTFMVEAVAENTSATQTVTKSQGNVLSMAYYVLDVLGDNYVSSGQRPAHGISFGAPCKTEGFHVAMPADFSDGLDVTGDIETPGGSITPVILYDDDTTALNVAITLSETAANFRRLTICYRTNDNDYSSVDVWHPDGKTVSLTATRTAGNSTTPTLWLKSKTVLISGTTINTTTSGTNYYLTSQTRADGNQTAINGDYIAVTQVIGYR